MQVMRKTIADYTAVCSRITHTVRTAEGIAGRMGYSNFIHKTDQQRFCPFHSNNTHQLGDTLSEINTPYGRI